MSEFINELREKLIVYNLSENYVFHVDDNRIIYEFTPQFPQEPYTLAWIRFNFNINKVVETLRNALNYDDNTHHYYIMCDNALVLLITAFEAYLVNNYNKVRTNSEMTEVDPIILRFQYKDDLKEKYNEFNIDIAHLDDTLWRKIFASGEHERGLIKLRNIVVHSGWDNFQNKSDMIDHNFVEEAIITIIKFIKIVENTIIRNFPNLNNLS